MAECPCIDVVPVHLVIDRVRRPNRLMHAWACGVAVADCYVGNVVLVALAPVRLLLSSSDGLGSEESDHINVLGIQAVSKPR